jgi:GntR family transcriptional regulator/MocR family aminotransferase
VVSAFEQLLAEGYTVGRIGSGTFVSEDLPQTPDLPRGALRPVGLRDRSELSERGEHHRNVGLHGAMFGNIPFNTGFCSVDARTLDALRRTVGRQFATFDPVNLGYSDPQGSPGLRNAIAEYLRAAREVRCDPEQVVVTGGAQQAIDIAIRILLDPGDEVWIEDPCYPTTRAALAAARARARPVPVDEAGMTVSEGIRRWPLAKAAFLTPSHQYPLGVVLSMARRLDILSWARESGAWIIEDDYDSEFRYAGRPLASLQGLDEAERVIYVGTLSKVLFPGLRVGYVVLPRELIRTYVSARYLVDRNPPTLLHGVVAEFINQGYFTSHIRRTRLTYQEMRDFLVGEIRRHLGSEVVLNVPNQGMHLVMRLNEISDVEVAVAARKAGLITRPLSPMFVEAEPANGLMLGFTGYSSHQMRTATARLAEVIHARSTPARPMRDRATVSGSTAHKTIPLVTPVSAGEKIPQ